MRLVPMFTVAGRATVLLALALSGATPLAAQTTYLVQDINTAADPAPGTEPRDLASAGGHLYFVGDDDGSGTEVRRIEADGSISFLRDLRPGSSTFSGGAEHLTAVGSGLFFVFDGVLWRTDGTFAGTLPVQAFGGTLSSLTNVDGTLYFVVDDITQLWKSDGTAAGTVPVGPGGYNLRAAGSRVFFLRHENATGTEPWTSDGTAAGTHLLKDVCAGACSGAHDEPFLTLGSMLFFRGLAQETGFEVWKSDGTSAGTTIVSDLAPGPQGGVGDVMAALEDAVLFTSTFPSPALWRTDGSAAGTTMVRPLGVEAMQRSNATVFMRAFETATGWEVWKTDGTAAGTVLVADVCPGPCSSLSDDTRFAAAPFGVAFTRFDGFEPELWTSDGTAEGTLRLLEDVRVDAFGPSSLPLYFSGEDDTNGRELWATDGTPGGTRLATNRVDNSSLWSQSYGPRGAVGDRVFLTAYRPDVGNELWTTRGTSATTEPLDLTPGLFGSEVFDTTALGGLFIFAARVSDALGSWRSDATAAGTFLLRPVVPSNGFVGVGGQSFFGANGNGFGLEPWRTDGTPSGTFQVADIGLGAASSQPLSFTAFQGAAFFVTLLEGRGLWRTDGTAVGTTPVVSRLCFPILGATAQQLFLTCVDPPTGHELWRSDGTAAGTSLVKDLEPGSQGIHVVQSAILGDVLFFTDGFQLWRSDGTDAGTLLLRDFLQIPVPDYTDRLMVSGGVLYFGGYAPASGLELWRTDGTATGTFMLRDIYPGQESGVLPDQYRETIVAVDGGVVFAAYTPGRGMELWKSDGTAAGTVPLPEIAPGPASSSPSMMVHAAGAVYVRATDGVTGYEPWAVQLTAPTVAIGDAAVAEGDAGTTDAVFEVRQLSPPLVAVTVSYTTIGGSAEAGSDFVPRSGLLTFGPGTTSLTLAVPVVGDLADEADETFTVVLAASGPIVIADAQGAGDIRDDDGPRLSAQGVSVAEGDAGTADAPFLLTLTTKDGTHTPAARAFGYSTESDTASSGIDFDPISGTLTFAAGTASGSTATVPVAVRGDTFDEPDELFALRLSSAGDASVSAPGVASILDDDGVASARPLELAHGTTVRGDLAPFGGPGLSRDYYLLQQHPEASYELVVDEASGDAAPLTVQRVAADGSTVLQSAVPVGTGTALSLRWFNTVAGPFSDQHVRVESASCGSTCGTDDTYRVRFYETTLRAARVNNTNGQTTVLLLQNLSDAAVLGRIHFWTEPGTSGTAQPFSVPARGTLVFDTTEIAPATGSLKVVHDAPYGALVGKVVALEPATGFSFDTPLTSKPR